jgi:Uma2 family endonuclease
LPDHTQLPDREGTRPKDCHWTPPPDHTQLPDQDGTFVKNSMESWQSHLLTDSLLPALEGLNPQGDYFIGEDCGIYWRLTDPPERGVKAPDWYLVLGVPKLLNGQMRRSYVLWQELLRPQMVLEYVSGDGEEERDRTAYEGKFWVYERAIQATYYGIYEVNSARLDMYELGLGYYNLLKPNERGHYPIASLGLELGLWQGSFGGYELFWMRWWDSQGNLLLTGREQAERVQREVERLTARLRSLGIDPEKA